MRSAVDRRLERIVKRLNAEKITVAISYDSMDRHWSMRWKAEWRVDLQWYERGWRNEPTVREVTGHGKGLDGALDDLERVINQHTFLDATAADA